MMCDPSASATLTVIGRFTCIRSMQFWGAFLVFAAFAVAGRSTWLLCLAVLLCLSVFLERAIRMVGSLVTFALQCGCLSQFFCICHGDWSTPCHLCSTAISRPPGEGCWSIGVLNARFLPRSAKVFAGICLCLKTDVHLFFSFHRSASRSVMSASKSSSHQRH